MNGLFTVIGGVFSVVLALFIGFNLTLVAALVCCTFALARLRTAAGPTA